MVLRIVACVRDRIDMLHAESTRDSLRHVENEVLRAVAVRALRDVLDDVPRPLHVRPLHRADEEGVLARLVPAEPEDDLVELAARKPHLHAEQSFLPLARLECQVCRPVDVLIRRFPDGITRIKPAKPQKCLWLQTLLQHFKVMTNQFLALGKRRTRIKKSTRRLLDGEWIPLKELPPQRVLLEPRAELLHPAPMHLAPSEEDDEAVQLARILRAIDALSEFYDI